MEEATDGLVLDFKTVSFRKIPNPFANDSIDEEDLLQQLNKPEMYILICDVKDIPDNIPMETNPRGQNLDTKVAKAIENSLLDPLSRDFYLLNRGLLLSAGSVLYDSNSHIAKISFPDKQFNGNVDGGHTYKIILGNREKLSIKQQYIKIEVLTGVDDIFQQLASARNTSEQVKDKSIAELEKRFNLIKDAFSTEPYAERIAYKENDDYSGDNVQKDIDVSDLLAIFNLFNIDKFPCGTYPITSYSSKNTCVQTYIHESKKNEEHPEKNPFIKMKPIMQDIIKLYDEIEMKMPNFYKGEDTGIKRFGAIIGVVSKKKESEEFVTKFYHKEIDYKISTGFIYPILGSFRALVEEKIGIYTWKSDPFIMLEKIGPKLVETTISSSRELGNNPNKTGKSPNLWTTLYMYVQMQEMVERSSENEEKGK